MEQLTLLPLLIFALLLGGAITGAVLTGWNLYKRNQKPIAPLPPKPLTLNYLLHEFLSIHIISKDEERVHWRLFCDNGIPPNDITIDRTGGTEVLVNNVTGERIPMDEDFFDKWGKRIDKTN